MTTEETTEKKKKAATAETPSKPGRKKSDASASGASDIAKAGYAAVFENWELVPEEEGPVDIDPSKLLVIFDVRSSVQDMDEFVKKCAGGIESPVKITKMRYMGENASLAVSPDPKVRVNVKKGEDYYVLVFGRRRSRAGIMLKFKTIPATLKNYKSWGEMVEAAYIENDARADMTPYDSAVVVKNLRDGGLLQDEIAQRVHWSPGKVSQYLGIFDLAEPVLKLVRDGLLTVTSARLLRPIKDQDAQVLIANRAVEKAYDEDQLKEAVKTYQAKQAAKAEAAGSDDKSKPARVAKQHGYDKAAIKHPPVADARKVLNWIDTRIKTMRARDADPAKIAFEKGRLRGHEEAAGLKELPKAALVEEEVETED